MKSQNIQTLQHNQAALHVVSHFFALNNACLLWGGGGWGAGRRVFSIWKRSALK